MEEIILELYSTWVKDVQRFNTREKFRSVKRREKQSRENVVETFR